MRDLTDKYRLGARGIAESVDALERLLVACKRYVRWRTFAPVPDRPQKASCLNAILLWLDRQPIETQRLILAEGHRILDELLQAEGPAIGPSLESRTAPFGAMRDAPPQGIEENPPRERANRPPPRRKAGG
jgi:hypothetical protein